MNAPDARIRDPAAAPPSSVAPPGRCKCQLSHSRQRSSATTPEAWSGLDGNNRESRLYRVAPISQNLVLAFLGQHVLGLPGSY